MREKSASSANSEKFDASSDTGLQDICGVRHLDESVNGTTEPEQLCGIGFKRFEDVRCWEAVATKTISRLRVSRSQLQARRRLHWFLLTSN